LNPVITSVYAMPHQ